MDASTQVPVNQRLIRLPEANDLEGALRRIDSSPATSAARQFILRHADQDKTWTGIFNILDGAFTLYAELAEALSVPFEQRSARGEALVHQWLNALTTDVEVRALVRSNIN